MVPARRIMSEAVSLRFPTAKAPCTTNPISEPSTACGRVRTMPLALTDKQLNLVMAFAADINAPEKRSLFLERVAAILTTRGRWDDDLVATACARALIGLAHRPAA